MTLRVWRYGLAASVAVALALLSVASGSVPWAQGQPDCTVTVKPGESIQKAIDGAKEGAVICLSAGTWQENIKITKSLTLRGAGQEQTVIDGVRRDYPVVWIWQTTQAISVKVEGLRIIGAEGGETGWCADLLICAHGVLIHGSAQATISSSTISGNGSDGIELWGSAQATISSSTISGNGDDGIWLGDLAKITIQESTVQGNGTNPGCKGSGWECNGLVMAYGKAVAQLRDVQIQGNAGWGVAAVRKQCWYDWDYFTGEVIFQGEIKLESIRENNQSGKLKGKGNLGDHPWNRPEVPDGQVCLP